MWLMQPFPQPILTPSFVKIPRTAASSAPPILSSSARIAVTCAGVPTVAGYTSLYKLLGEELKLVAAQAIDTIVTSRLATAPTRNRRLICDCLLTSVMLIKPSSSLRRGSLHR